MELARRFIRGSVLNLADQGLRFAAVFVMTPIMVGSLGREDYGFWVLLMSIIGHYSLLDFGMSFSISRFFSKAIGAGDDDGLAVIFSTSLAIMARIGMVAMGLTLAGFAIVPLFGMDAATVRLTRTIIVLYGIYFSAAFPVGVCRSLLKSRLRYDLLVMGSAVQIVTGSILLYVFLTRGHGLLTLAVINVSVGFLEYGIVCWAALRGRPKRFRIGRDLVDRQQAKLMLNYSLVMFVFQVASSMRTRLDPIIVGSVVGYSAVTLHAVGARFPIYLTDVVGAVLGGQLLAVFSQSQGRTGTPEESTRQLMMATRVSSVIAAFCGSSMIFYGHDFITRWMGPGYEISYHIMVMMMIPYIFFLSQVPSHGYTYSLAKHRYLAVTAIVGGVASLAVSLVLVRFYGVYGVVLASCCEMLVVYLLVVPANICKIGGIRRRCYYGEALAHPLLLSLAILAPFFAVACRFLDADYLRLVSLGAVQIVYFVPLAYLLILRGSERALFRSLWQRSHR